jgi:hypothetical protein
MSTAVTDAMVDETIAAAQRIFKAIKNV